MNGNSKANESQKVSRRKFLKQVVFVTAAIGLGSGVTAGVLQLISVLNQVTGFKKNLALLLVAHVVGVVIFQMKLMLNAIRPMAA